MKRILLASTAVAGLAALASPVSAAEPIQVSLGGSFEFYSGWIDTEAAGRPSNEFRIDPEVWVRSQAVSDNGLTYGVMLELETASSYGGPGSPGRNMRTDEAVGFISGSFGRVEFGDEDGASDRMSVFPTTVGFAQMDGDYNNFLVDFTSGLTRPGGTEIVYHKVVDTGDSTKVSYFTPTFAGLQAGVSYAAELDEGDSVVVGGANRYNSAVEAGLRYTGEFNGVGVLASVTGTHLNGSGTYSDINAWGVGARVSYAGFSLGGTYADQDGVRYNAGNGSTWGGQTIDNTGARVAGNVSARQAGGTSFEEITQTWTVGAAYQQGPVGVSFVYANADTNTLIDSGFESYFLGASYQLAPGLVLAADVVIYDNDAIQQVQSATSTKDDQGYLVMVGTILSF